MDDYKMKKDKVAYEPHETSALLPKSPFETAEAPQQNGVSYWRLHLFLFLEARTLGGLVYEKFTILLILLSVASFVLSTLFVPEYYPSPLADRCGPICDALWFGNNPNNALSFLGIGSTSVLEMFIVGVFSVDYILRIYTADLLDERYSGVGGRIRFIPTFFSIVDLASTVPFYVDSFLLPNTDLAASNFLRMFRLLRMMRMEGRYDLALGMIDDVLYEQRGILGTALFVGCTVWSVVASCYYLAERHNKDMIYCGDASCVLDLDDIDTSLCVFNSWGMVNCTLAGCPDVGTGGCYNLYQSIVDASYWSLINLFGEFPLVDQHSAAGQVVGTFTAVIAVGIFGIPAGILGCGLQDHILRRRQMKNEDSLVTTTDSPEDVEVKDKAQDWDLVEPSCGDPTTCQGWVFNLLHLQDTPSSVFVEWFINLLVIGTSLTFMFGTLGTKLITPSTSTFFDIFEFFSVIIFTLEYILKVYSAAENPMCKGLQGRLKYATSFLPMVDLLSFIPYWINLGFYHHIITYSNRSRVETLVKCLRLLRLLRFDKYTNAFRTFDNVIVANIDILTVTGFSAILLWIFFSAILYFTERNNPNPDTANYYKTVPHAMWITLLNLSGECPLAYYSIWGKIVMGFVGLFATAIFGIPIGVLGGGFQELMEDTLQDTPDDRVENIENNSYNGTVIEQLCYNFVNGKGTLVALIFEIVIYMLIMATVAIGIIQTVPGRENAFHLIEWIAVLTFTVEYIIRFIGAGADLEFHPKNTFFSAIWVRIKFMFSFYSIVDLLAILPFYLSIAMPGSLIDKNDEYLRMLRLLRLLKLEKYFPSITLIDDVLRLKKNVLTVTCYAALTLWVIFAGFLYLAEYKDHSMDIDDVPLYGCDENCTMSDRFNNYFRSFVFTGIHLTGDYPIVEYDGLGRILCFFMVIAAVGVVSVPAAVFATGFLQITYSKDEVDASGDDWFDIRYKELEGKNPPPSTLGPSIDKWQQSVHNYLYGKKMDNGMIEWTFFSRMGRLFFFSLIITNVIAVFLESIPEIDCYVGNQPGNFFDVFEAISVWFFTIEYILHLFSAPKTREALFSTWVYATTFFGIVDLISIAPWFIQEGLVLTGKLSPNDDTAKIFRIFRIFRILQLEDFVTAFSKFDNAVRACKDVLKATGLMAILIWVGCGALFFIFEQNNPNFRECNPGIPLRNTEDGQPGCYDFPSTAACNEFYPNMCSQVAFTDMPNSLFYVAVFLGGEWGFTDFTIPGQLVCIFLCVAGILLYSLPTGVFVEKFGFILSLPVE